MSTAYYALFHLLIDDALGVLAPATPIGLDHVMRRAFHHADMKNACKGFASSSLQEQLYSLIALPVDINLAFVARTFVELQRNRHLADYDTTDTWSRMQAEALVGSVEEAFSKWKKVRSSSDAKVFLSSLLLYKQWQRS
ncbi:MAG: hypothetical protein ORN29_00370 [Rhodoferax sp.]|nr:hypothetical protein [Rhodoferax sp.]